VNDKSSSRKGIPATSRAVLSIRLWGPVPDDPSGELAWKTATPAASAARDLIEASGGTGVVTKGNLLVSNFSSISTAILAARRIQWAVSGSVEAGGSENGSAAILIQSEQDPSLQQSSTPPDPPLQHALPGQILLAEATCQSLGNLPGLSLLPPSAGLRELRWRGSENPSSHLQDDRILDQLIHQHGLEDSIPSEPEAMVALAPVPVAVTPPAPEMEPQARVPADDPAGPSYGSWLSRVRQMPLWLKGIAAGIPLVVALTLFVVFIHTKAPAHTPDNPTQVLHPSPKQSGSTVPTDATAHVEKTVASDKPVDSVKKETPQKIKDPRKPLHPPPDEHKQTGSCGLNAGEIPHALSIAEAHFQNRQYKDAERGYRSVLACQPENGPAVRGAERVRSALQLQQSSNP
jgi:hypothetical protein